MEEFHFVPEWQGPLSGRSFEKQTEDAINGVIQAINDAGTAVPSDAYPKAPGHAAPGTSTDYSRGDHVHPAQQSISGNAGSATKLQNTRLIVLSGDASGQGSFDGSADVDIPVEIPAASLNGAGLMSAADKAKLDSVQAGANNYVLPQATATALGGVIVDTALSSTSTNPVQNRVLQGVIQQISDTAATPATPDRAGIMSATDKAKLDSLSQYPRISEIDSTAVFYGGGEVPDPDEAGGGIHAVQKNLSASMPTRISVRANRGVYVDESTADTGSSEYVTLTFGIDGARLAGDGLKGEAGLLQINDQQMDRWTKSKTANPLVFYPVASTAFEVFAYFLYSETSPADPNEPKGPDNPSTITGVSSIAFKHYASPGVSETSYSVSLGGTYYGGVVDCASGVMTVAHAAVTPASLSVDISSAPAALPLEYADTYGRSITSEDGDTLTLAAGSATGGTVVYRLATPQTVQLTALAAMTTLPAGSDKYELRPNTLVSSTSGVEMQAGYQRFVAVDAALNLNSANPVQNSAVTAALALKVNTADVITSNQIDALFA